MKFKLSFSNTPYGSVRVWMHYDEEDFSTVLDSKEYALFELLSIWGGSDKKENRVRSWEFSTTLIPFLKEKFGHYKDVEMNI